MSDEQWQNGAPSLAPTCALLNRVAYRPFHLDAADGIAGVDRCMARPGYWKTNQQRPALRLGKGRPGMGNAIGYGVTWLMNVPQLASEVRAAFGIYSLASQIVPSASATAAEYAPQPAVLAPPQAL